jgi:hypothetical protein
VQEHLESTNAGRAAISVFVAITILSLVLWNLPDSELKSASDPAVRPLILVAGLNQNWGVFAPDPRRQTLDFVARVGYADGNEQTLDYPRGGRAIGSYWDYRWRKWYEAVRTDRHDELWQPAAAWFAQRERAAGRRPVTVTLVRRWYDLFPPGKGPEHGPWQESAFYTYEVPPPAGEAAGG